MLHRPLLAMRIAFAALLCLTATACVGTNAEDKAEVAAIERGRAYAHAVCAECHAVEPGEPASPYPYAPTFTSVANTPGMTSIAFRAWMQSEHPTMPHLIVGPEHLDDLWAYLTTLKSE